MKLESEFVSGDAGRQLGIARAGGEVLGVEGSKYVDLVALHVTGLAVFWREVEDWLALMPQVRALKSCWHEAAGPIGRPADRPAAWIEHHDVAGQVRVFAAQAVIQPRPHRRIALHDPAAVHLNHGRAMGERIGVQALDDRQFVEMLIDVLEAIGPPQSRLAVLLERALARQQLLLLNAVAANLDLDFLAVAFLQLGLMVPGVHRRRAAVHKQEDHAFGLRREMRGAGRERIGRWLGGKAMLNEKTILVEERRERKPGEACAGLPEEFAAVTGAKAVRSSELGMRSGHDQSTYTNSLRLRINLHNSVSVCSSLIFQRCKKTRAMSVSRSRGSRLSANS